jgi:hypothetical protein
VLRFQIYLLWIRIRLFRKFHVRICIRPYRSSNIFQIERIFQFISAEYHLYVTDLFWLLHFQNNIRHCYFFRLGSKSGTGSEQ